MHEEKGRNAASAVNLGGQVVLVTGAGSGIGRAMAQAFASVAAEVLVLDVVPARVEETVRIIEDSGGQAHPVVLDLLDAGNIAVFADQVSTKWGRMDVLCNNAGIMDKMQLPADTPAELWNRVLSVNLTAPFLLTKALLPIMLANRRGCIINTASEAGLRGGAGGIAYTASKHGLVGLTKSLAWAYANEGLRCNAICPGATATNVAGANRGADFDHRGA